MSGELASCPFCGANQEMADHLNRKRSPQTPTQYAPELINIASPIAEAEWAVYCHNCGIYGQPQRTGLNYSESSAKENAVRAWNDRVPAWAETES